MAGAKEVPTKIPTVLVTGFLGAGKSTLVEHTLATCKGLKLGLVVNELDMVLRSAPLVRDASADGKLHLVTLEDGCVCCERSGELLPCIEKLLAQAEGAAPFDAILIECTGLAEPGQLKSALLDARSHTAHVLARIELATVVAVVDAAAFQAQYESRERSRLDKQCIVDLLVAQVEGASLIVLNKAERVDAQQLQTVSDLLRALNPSARLVRTSFARVPLQTLLDAPRDAPHDEPSAKRARADGGGAVALDGACVECEPPDAAALRSGAQLSRRVRAAVTSVRYARARPFHPLRLHARVILCLPTRRAAGTSLCATAADDGANPFAQLLRAKGFAWLASQPTSRFAWAYAGCHFSLLEHADWAGGPAAQALEFIGLALDEDALCARLDGCLLTDAELDYFRRGEVPPADDAATPAADEAGGAAADDVRSGRREP